MKTSFLVCSLLLNVAAVTHAATIDLFSSTATTNNTASPTITIVPHPAWGAAAPGASWISTATTGDPSAAGYTVIPNGTVTTFSQVFNLPMAATGGALSVMADDTTSVVLNGSVVKTAAPLSAIGPACVSQAIGCTTLFGGNITFAELSPHLVVGQNTLSFAVAQLGASSFGLTYSGSIAYADIGAAEMPEPVSFVLCATGLLIGAGYRRWRRASSQRT
jgi:hypothetical protein